MAITSPARFESLRPPSKLLHHSTMAPPEGPRGMTPPAGPRGSRGGHRGGIQKRRGGGPIKVDRDGDMVMGVDGGSSKHSGSGSGTENGGRRSGRGSRASAPARSESRQQAILRALGKDAGAGQSTRSRRGDGSVTLVVRGLQQSKASHNDGGGLRDLLSFLERKATTVGKLSRPVTIKKVCLTGI